MPRIAIYQVSSETLIGYVNQELLEQLQSWSNSPICWTRVLSSQEISVTEPLYILDDMGEIIEGGLVYEYLPRVLLTLLPGEKQFTTHEILLDRVVRNTRRDKKQAKARILYTQSRADILV